MNARIVAVALAGLAAAVLATGCDEPRKEKPWERISRIRLHYKVAPNWYEMQTGKDGLRVLVMDLTVNNIGKDSLKRVTMVLHILGDDGKDRIAQALTLDTSNVVPGVPGKITVRVPGVDVRPGEEVMLQMEGQPTPDEMKKYPEYASGVS